MVVVQVRSRQTELPFEERVFGGGALETLYAHRLARWFTDHVLTRPTVNRLYGWWQRSPRSRARIPEFVRTLGIDASEAERPLEAYESLDAFFTRRLRPGARPIDPDPARLVSPADARVLVYPRVDGAELAIKGSRIDLAELVADETIARRYRHGTALVARLAPADYHRFHFPDDGVAGAARDVAGKLHSVHPIALGHGAPSLRNKRTVTTLESRGFGPLVLVEVGALLVGDIVQTYRPGPVTRGDEKGLFRFGGSTVVLLAEAGRLAFDDDLVEASGRGMETMVRVGTAIGTRCGSA